MLGQFTSDHLEKKFGKFRQGLGGIYFITAQQVLEKVATTKAKLLLQINCSIEAVSCHTCNKCGYLMD